MYRMYRICRIRWTDRRASRMAEALDVLEVEDLEGCSTPS